MQKRIVTRQKLLNKEGHVINSGYATDLLWEYSRDDIKAPKMRIKEWDYYIVYNSKYAIAATVADNGYMGFASASVLEWDNESQITTAVMTPFPMGRFHMPSTSKKGDVHFCNKRAKIDFSLNDNNRNIDILFNKYSGEDTLSGKLSLYQQQDAETMVIVTPFKDNKKAFYYNQKINCMPACGQVTLGGKTYKFDPSDSFGTLDWGRGVWTYSNTWYWGSASGMVGDDLFGFNIGYGFGDTSNASENMLFFNNQAHKLDQIEFHIPDDYLKPWRFTSSDNRFEMDFVPILDRCDVTDALIIKSDQHQVFGRFTGTAVLNDGRKMILKDFVGFAEKVMNRW